MAALGHTVDSGSGASGDYASLNALEAAQGQDLTDGGGDTYTATCTTTGDNAADTTATAFLDWTTGVANYISIVAASGDEALITGYVATRYRMELAAIAISISEDYVRMNALQIQITASSGTVAAIDATVSNGISSNASDIRITNCRLTGVLSGTAVGSGVMCYESTNGYGHVTIWNTIINNWTTGVQGDYCETVKIYNSVVYGCTTGIKQLGETYAVLTAKNNAVFNNTDDFVPQASSTIDFNASDDEDGTNSQLMVSTDDWAAEVVDAAGGDFTLVLGSVCDDNGTNNPGAGLYLDDIAGTVRVSTWDIGAFELLAAGGSIISMIIHHLRQVGGL